MLQILFQEAFCAWFHVSAVAVSTSHFVRSHVSHPSVILSLSLSYLPARDPGRRGGGIGRIVRIVSHILLSPRPLVIVHMFLSFGAQKEPWIMDHGS